MATAKKRSTKKTVKMQSFKVAKSPKKFVSFKVTEQTIYWLVLLALIMALTIWILNVQMDATRAIEALNI